MSSPTLDADELSDEREDELDGESWMPFGDQRRPGSDGLIVADVPVQIDVADPADGAQPVGFWPCLGCEASNPMGATECVSCGLPFLAFAKTPPVFHVPGLGDIFQRSRPQQIAFIAAAGFVLLAALLGLMGIFGVIL